MAQERIVVVEDSPTQALKLQILLEQEGFDAVCAYTAEEAMDELNRRLPQLLIVDYHLPGIQGDEFCRQIHLNLSTRSIPILMLTADEAVATQMHGLESGADDFVSKSEDSEILLLRVHNLLRRSRQSASIAEMSRPRFRRPRVLVIDDSETYRETLAAELREEGCEVTLMHSGWEGLDYLEENEFDCVLVDMVMPDLDGVEVCQELAKKRNASESPIVILMISAYENKENVARALEAGADDFVGKSTQMSLLRARLRALLRRKFLLEENSRIIEEFKAKEMQALRATAEKEAAEAKVMLAAGLEKANAELADTNRKLKEAQLHLIQSEKMASLGQLVAGIAHEINNPLSFALSNVFTIQQWLEEVTADPGNQLTEGTARRLEKIAARIADSGQGLDRVRDLVVQLRTFSRLDEGEFKTVDLREAFESVVLFLRHKMSARITVVREFAEDNMLSCYAGQLNQVLMNVVANAVDAIKGEGTIILRTVRRDDGFFEIAVKDSGQGIPADIRDRVFDPFFTTKAVGQGTGLGLAISYGIVQSHRGRIEVDSEIGQGTEIRILIPMDLT
jgi:two-component system NtrC family sensor kinase